MKQRRGEGALFARMRKGDWRQNHGTSYREHQTKKATKQQTKENKKIGLAVVETLPARLAALYEVRSRTGLSSVEDNGARFPSVSERYERNFKLRLIPVFQNVAGAHFGTPSAER